jgi:very-short-patch-repair endonuclease
MRPGQRVETAVDHLHGGQLQSRCHPEARVAALAMRQGGAISRRQLLTCGLSARAVERRLDAGRLVLVHRGVYAVGGAWLGTRGRSFAALLSAGPDAVLSHRWAASMWGLLAEPAEDVELSVPRSTPHRRLDLVVHGTRFGPGDVRRRDDLPLTSPARTLLDIAGLVDPSELEHAVREARVMRLVTVAHLRATVREARGRRGVAHLARAVSSDDAAPTRSHLERVMVRLIRRARLPRPLVNQRIGAYEVDLLWPTHRVVVETDGWAAHGHRDAFERDRWRDSELQALGFVVLRFTWRQISDEPDVVVRRLARVLAARERDGLAARRASVPG